MGIICRCGVASSVGSLLRACGVYHCSTNNLCPTSPAPAFPSCGTMYCWFSHLLGSLWKIPTLYCDLSDSQHLIIPFIPTLPYLCCFLLFFIELSPFTPWTFGISWLSLHFLSKFLCPLCLQWLLSLCRLASSCFILNLSVLRQVWPERVCAVAACELHIYWADCHDTARQEKYRLSSSPCLFLFYFLL